MFHVKHSLQSLADAEIPEDDVEQFLDIDPAGDAADGAQAPSAQMSSADEFGDWIAATSRLNAQPALPRSSA